MNSQTLQKKTSNKIQTLSLFKENISRWFNGQYNSSEIEQLRSQIKLNVQYVHSIVMETGSLRLMPTIPPSATGGLVIRDYDPFINILGNSGYGVSFIPAIIEMIDESIDVLKSPTYLGKLLTKLQNTENRI
jgi:hypothetical protein